MRCEASLCSENRLEHFGMNAMLPNALLHAECVVLFQYSVKYIQDGSSWHTFVRGQQTRLCKKAASDCLLSL